MKRRKLFRLSVGVTIGWIILEPFVLEPYWLKVKKINISVASASHRIVHITTKVNEII